MPTARNPDFATEKQCFDNLRTKRLSWSGLLLGKLGPYSRFSFLQKNTFYLCLHILRNLYQTWTRVSNLEKSREILTSLAPSRSKKLNFHSLSLLDFQDFEEKILFLFSIYENLKHKSRSLLDLDLEFSSGSVCVWN